MIAVQTPPQTISVQSSKTISKSQTYLNDSVDPSKSSIEIKFNNLMSKQITSQVQNRTAYDLANQLVRISTTGFDINFEIAETENEIIFVAENEKAQNIIVLDEDGDVMISHSPFSGKGRREFIDNKNIDLEAVTYKFLSL
jgi:hypothetical protein